MKKFYLLSFLFIYSFLSYGQADCSSAVTIEENINYTKTLIPFESQWYKFTMPQDGKLQITWSNSANAQIELLSGDCNNLQDEGGGLGLISYLDGVEGEELFIRLSTFEFSNQDIDFTLEVNDVVQGDLCDDPILAIETSEGVNTVPPTLNQYIWFQFQMPSEAKKVRITNPLNTEIELYAENCTTFKGSNFFSQEGDFVTINPQPNEIINVRFTLDGTGDFDWNLSFEDFQIGEKCDLAAAANLGINSVPDSDVTYYWYSFTMPAEGGGLSISSSVSNNVQIYTDGCSVQEFVDSGSGSVTASDLAPNEEVLIRWNLNNGSNFDWELVGPPSDQSITFNPLDVKTVGDPDFDLTATASSGLEISYTSSNTDVATINGSTVSIIAVGTTVITASQNGNEEFNAADPIEQTLTVEKAEQTINFNSLTDITFGNANFDLTATASSELDVTYSSSNTAVATISGNTVTIVGAGTTTITATQDGNDDYNPADPVEQTLTINKANQSITFDAIADKEVADPDFTIPASANSGLDLTFDVSGPATVSGNTLSLTGETGTVSITASQAGNDNYKAAQPVKVEFLVTDPAKTNQTITFAELEARTYGVLGINLNGTSSSGLSLTYESSNPSVATIDGNLIVVNTAGTTTITASQEGDATYNPAEPVSRELVINKADQTITVSAIGDKEVTDEPFDVEASVNSGLQLSYAVEGPATISGNTLTLSEEAGTVTVTVSQAGNVNYNSASESVSFEVSNPRSDQTISITEIADKFTNDDPFEVEASTTSELALTYEVSGPATIDGTTVTLDGTTGTVEITVSQAGNENYNPALETISFEVTEDPCLDFAATATASTVSCAGSADGTITVETAEGTAPFSYSLAGAEAVENNEFTELEAGEYTVEVTDANGCRETVTATITSPDALEITAEVENSNSINGNGSISLTVSGGTGDYTYSWSNEATTSSLEELEVGEYTVTVTDENGCTIEESFTIGGVTANEEAFIESLLIFPNPAKDIVQLQHGENTRSLKLYDARGKLLNEITTEGESSELNVSQLPSGLYFIRQDGAPQLYRFVKE